MVAGLSTNCLDVIGGELRNLALKAVFFEEALCGSVARDVHASPIPPSSKDISSFDTYCWDVMMKNLLYGTYIKLTKKLNSKTLRGS